MTSTTAQESTPDYASLRRDGLHWLERLAGDQWTDFNPHDPGITILEQVCYALTDLLYRNGYPLPDLLARGGEETYAGLFGADRVLVSRPVTLLDLRKLAIDVAGVRNAWVETVEAPQPTAYRLPGQGTAEPRLDLTGGKEATAVRPRGLLRVWLEKSDEEDVNSAEIVRNVARRLHANRPLGCDFDAIALLEQQPITVRAGIEIGPDANPEDVYLGVLRNLDRHISPGVPFSTLEQRLATGKAMDALFDGPLLEHGFIDDDELSALERRTSLRVSDLIAAVMATEGVRVVTHLVVESAGTTEKWLLELDPQRVPRLDVAASVLSLYKRRLPLAVDREAIRQRYDELRAGAAARPLVNSQPPLPAGRDRRVDYYHSLMHQFPALYGIGEAGLPADASPQRRAQARQLQAYLLLFDQILANGLAQLAHVRDLFGSDQRYPQTYFAGRVEGPRLGLEALWRQSDAAARALRLDQISEEPTTPPEQTTRPVDWRRKHRLLDHLLARFAERFLDYAGFQSGSGSSPPERLAHDKQALLGRYPALGAGRGSGCDLLAPWGADNRSALEQRLALGLGVAASSEPPYQAQDERFYLVETLLLRPCAGDRRQQAPLLLGPARPDPWSLQLSLVFPAQAPRFADANFRRFVEQSARDLAPAHLVLSVHWLDPDPMAEFDAAWREWTQCQRDERARNDQARAGGADPAFALRHARDRLLDLLGLGRTYPLRDPAVGATTTVAYGTSARIPLAYGQPGVVYRLCDSAGKPLTPAVTATGSGGELTLETPEITDDRLFTIEAVKSSNGLSALLLGQATVKVGIDQGLSAQVVGAELLVPGVDPPAPGAPRIVDWGVGVSVEVQASQEGVDYRLEADGSGATLSTADVRGNRGTITLRSVALKEDTDLRVRATKTFAPDEHREAKTGLLDTVLPVKVRANPGLAVTLKATTVGYGADASVSVAATQASAVYALLVHATADSEVIHKDPAAADLRIPVDGKEPVYVRPPAAATPGALPPGFRATGASVAGNGGARSLSLSVLRADTTFLVQAQKNHRSGDGGSVTSTVYLTQRAAVLVRPDPAPTLRLRAALRDGVLQAPIQVEGGQSGVFYHFSNAADGQALAAPVYFHQRDAADSTRNKGIGQLCIGVDLAVTPPLSAARVAANPDLATLAPEPPQLQAAGLRSDTRLSVRAVKAQTGVEVVFETTVAALWQDAATGGAG